ncbi:hypothetical protein DV738_g1701, partial [Chaetothyriales sp. CBS 135597]
MFTLTTAAAIISTLALANFALAVAPGIYTCSGRHWTGDCHWTPISKKYKRCLPIVNKGGIVSFGPDAGLWVEIFEDSACSKIAYNTLVFPGLPDMTPWLEPTKNTTYVIVHDCETDLTAWNCY